MVNRLRIWAQRAKTELLALWIAARDPRTPLAARLLALAVAAYAFSPIDLIPDFIPIFGLLDDLVLLPLGVWLAVRLIPAALMVEFRTAARALVERPTSRVAAVLIIALWVALLAGLAWWLWPR